MDKNATIGLGLILIAFVCVVGLLKGYDGYLMTSAIATIAGVCGWLIGRRE